MSPSKCPHCEIPLTPEEKASGNCPVCKRSLTAIGAPLPQRELPRYQAGAWSEPESRSVAVAGKAILGWATLRTALGQLVFGLLLMVICTPIFYLLVLPGDRGSEVVRGTLAIAFGIGAVVGLILALASICLTAAGPTETEAQPLAILCLCCLVVSAAVALVITYGTIHNSDVQRRTLFNDMNRPFDRPQQPRKIPEPWQGSSLQVLGLLAVGVGFLGHLFLALFLSQVARHLGQRTLAASLIAYLIVHAAFTIGTILVGLLLRAGNQPANMARFQPEEVIGWIVVAISLGIYLWFVGLVVTLRVAVTRLLLGRKVSASAYDLV